MSDIKQTKSIRKGPRREIICCNDSYRVKEGPEKGRYVSGGERMYVKVCAKRSDGMNNPDSDPKKRNDHNFPDCEGCTKWISILKEMK